jgi:peptide/nickel transport system ATP-binding protein
MSAALPPLPDRGGPAQPLLTVKGLLKHFPVKKGLFGGTSAKVRAVDGIDFEVLKGETLGVVGESGCGKSTTARLLLRLFDPTAGEIVFDGEPVGSRSLGLTEFRRQCQMVFQDSYSRLTQAHRRGGGRLRPAGSWRAEAGGHRPRSRPPRACRAGAASLRGALSARAFRRPAPAGGTSPARWRSSRGSSSSTRQSSALDKSVEAQVLNLLLDLKAEFGLTYVFICHDLTSSGSSPIGVMVMYLGKVAEIGRSEDVFERAQHPYTAALLSSMPSLDPDNRTEVAPLAGDPPNPINPPAGCRFHTRCSFAEPVCSAKEPPLALTEGDHRAACLMVQPGSGHSQAAAGPRVGLAA